LTVAAWCGCYGVLVHYYAAALFQKIIMLLLSPLQNGQPMRLFIFSFSNYFSMV
jgi:hypothetical protein